MIRTSKVIPSLLHRVRPACLFRQNWLLATKFNNFFNRLLNFITIRHVPPIGGTFKNAPHHWSPLLTEDFWRGNIFYTIGANNEPNNKKGVHQ
jgi:hypothetical protein